jgi:UDP-N-acetylglucosamine 1-carboxyvinyltransferase
VTKYIISGGKQLHGEVVISGAKNAALAIMPATLLVDGVCRIENIPVISDVEMLLKILKQMGAKIRLVNSHTLDIDCTGVKTHDATFDMMRRIRASYYLIGALLGRFGKANVAMPGGCNFGGARPIDQHIKGFTAMGATV